MHHRTHSGPVELKQPSPYTLRGSRFSIVFLTIFFLSIHQTSCSSVSVTLNEAATLTRGGKKKWRTNYTNGNATTCCLTDAYFFPLLSMSPSGVTFPPTAPSTLKWEVIYRWYLLSKLLQDESSELMSRSKDLSWNQRRFLTWTKAHGFVTLFTPVQRPL